MRRGEVTSVTHTANDADIGGRFGRHPREKGGGGFADGFDQGLFGGRAILGFDAKGVGR